MSVFKIICPNKTLFLAMRTINFLRIQDVLKSQIHKNTKRNLVGYPLQIVAAIHKTLTILIYKRAVIRQYMHNKIKAST